jgi:hypothetical protein
MKKSFIMYVLITIWVAPLFANVPKILIEINFQDGGFHHKYIFAKDLKLQNTYEMILVDENNFKKKRVLTEQQFDQIRSRTNRLIWENKFKRTSRSTGKCTKYVDVQLGSEKTTVCRENAAMTGKSFGFLNSLNHFVLKK